MLYGYWEQRYGLKKFLSLEFSAFWWTIQKPACWTYKNIKEHNFKIYFIETFSTQK